MCWASPFKRRRRGSGGEKRRESASLRQVRFGGKNVCLVMLKANRGLPCLCELFEADKLAPVIDGPYRFSEAREALRHFAAAKQKGKIVVTMD